MSPPKDTWNPAQYERFKDQRSRPFYDLMGLVIRHAGMQVADLGCGTGELTQVLHQSLGAAATVGTDNSQSMLAKTRSFEGGGLSFKAQDLRDFREEQRYDLIFSNAAIQWIEDHPELFARLAEGLRPGGQLAIQMPANHDHPSHQLAARVAQESPFREALKDYQRASPVLAPEEYSLLLDKLGFEPQHVRLQVYLHHLASREDVIEWVKGTLLTDYEKRMTPELYAQFLKRYRDALFGVIEDLKPYPYAFKRVLIWGRKKS